jgi:hypothetical protein
MRSVPDRKRHLRTNPAIARILNQHWDLPASPDFTTQLEALSVFR